MLGAIIGDIVESRWEFDPTMSKVVYPRNNFVKHFL